MPEDVSAADSYERQRVEVLDSAMAYIDTQPSAAGRDAVVFLHGNPTSSYLWRNVIPHVEPLARCLAPDLIGMGDSGPSGDGSYRFADHLRYIDAWLDTVLPDARVTLVIHDWGSSLGFEWARRHEDRVRAICYMEAFLAPFPTMPAEGTMFDLLRGEQGEQLVLEENYFIENVLGPSSRPRRSRSTASPTSKRARRGCRRCSGLARCPSRTGRRTTRRWCGRTPSGSARARCRSC